MYGSSVPKLHVELLTHLLNDDDWDGDDGFDSGLRIAYGMPCRSSVCKQGLLGPAEVLCSVALLPIK